MSGVLAVEVRAALVELTHGQYGLADHATLAARTDLAHATATVRKSLIVGSELARVVHDVLARTPMPVSARQPPSKSELPSTTPSPHTPRHRRRPTR